VLFLPLLPVYSESSTTGIPRFGGNHRSWRSAFSSLVERLIIFGGEGWDNLLGLGGTIGAGACVRYEVMAGGAGVAEYLIGSEGMGGTGGAGVYGRGMGV